MRVQGERMNILCAIDDTPVAGTLSCLFDGLFREERHHANL
jgi:hypothetical protein